MVLGGGLKLRAVGLLQALKAVDDLLYHGQVVAHLVAAYGGEVGVGLLQGKGLVSKLPVGRSRPDGREALIV